MAPTVPQREIDYCWEVVGEATSLEKSQNIKHLSEALLSKPGHNIAMYGYIIAIIWWPYGNISHMIVII